MGMSSKGKLTSFIQADIPSPKLHSGRSMASPQDAQEVLHLEGALLPLISVYEYVCEIPHIGVFNPEIVAVNSHIFR